MAICQAFWHVSDHGRTEVADADLSGMERPPSADSGGGSERPTREREHLVGMRTRVINRMKGSLIRLGIRDFNPKLRKAPERVATQRTLEGTLIPPNTLAELRRDMVQLRFVNEQIAEIEDARQQQLEQGPQPQEGANTQVLQLASISSIGIETAEMLTHEVFCRAQRAVARYAGLTGAPDERAAGVGARKGSPKPGIPGSVAA